MTAAPGIVIGVPASTGLLTHGRYLELLALEGGRIAAMPADHLDAPVPAVDGWTMERVVRHTGKVHQWVTATLAGDAAADLPGLPRGAGCLRAYRRSLDSLLDELSRHDPTEPVSTFAGRGSVLFWSRRQANEVAVHRLDVADALAAATGALPDPVEADLAVDGIDEWCRLFLAVRWPHRYGAFPVELRGRCLMFAAHASGRWAVTFGADGTAVEVDGPDASVDGDVQISGGAADLLAVLWRRRPLDLVTVEGRTGLAERLIDISRF